VQKEAEQVPQPWLRGGQAFGEPGLMRRDLLAERGQTGEGRGEAFYEVG
jgi:hypothetical protein